MKPLSQTHAILGACLLLTIVASGRELAAFRIPDSNQNFLFNWSPPLASASTKRASKSVEGITTILAKRFKTTQRPGGVSITFYEGILCQSDRDKGDKLGDPIGSAVASFGEWSINYSGSPLVLVKGKWIPLADLSEKTFDPARPIPTETYTGEEAIRKLREMGLEPPDDMDPKRKEKVRK